MPERAGRRSASREIEEAMSALYQDQNTHRAVGRALVANHSRAVSRALVANHSRAVSRALNAYSLSQVLGQLGS
jgi:hypothetical protein